jgi:hypothetical protein
MKIQTASFSRNGTAKFEGVLKAVQDDGTPTSFNRKVDLYDDKRIERFIDDMASRFFLTLDEVRTELDIRIVELEKGANAADGLPDDSDGKRNQASILVDLASDADLWHTPVGIAFATVTVDGHLETWNIRSKQFKDFLSYRFFQQEDKSPGGQALTDALGVLSGKALFEGLEHEVYTRIAEIDGVIYLDLANDDWEAVKITSNGWEVTADIPVRFRRPRGMNSLPHPSQRGDVNLLRTLLNLETESDDEWVLFVACLVQSLRGRGPYPVLVFFGEHGSAKSTAARVYRRIIDPNTADLRSPPRDERDLRIQAHNGLVIGYDNLTSLPEWLSNALCRLSTGGGMGTREMYSDDDEVLFDGQRPIVLNGIEEIASRADLVDRTVILELKAIQKKKRRTETAFWKEFDDIHAIVLGGLLDAVVIGLINEPNTHLAELPRMADFAIWASAAEAGFGVAEGTFISAYNANRANANDAAIHASPIGPYVLLFAQANPAGWHGTATDLLSDLELFTPPQILGMKTWPKRPNTLSGKLRIITPNLRAKGIEVSQDREGAARHIHIVPIIEGSWPEEVDDRHLRHDRHSTTPSNDAHDAHDVVQSELANETPKCAGCGDTVDRADMVYTTSGGVRHSKCEVSL